MSSLQTVQNYHSKWFSALWKFKQRRAVFSYPMAWIFCCHVIGISHPFLSFKLFPTLICFFISSFTTTCSWCPSRPVNQFIINSYFSVSISSPAVSRIYPSPFVCRQYCPKPDLADFHTFPYTNADSIPDRMETRLTLNYQ